MLLIAPDSFKGTLAAWEVSAALARGARAASGVEIVELPLADGGEGTAEVVRRATGGVGVDAETVDPWGTRRRARFVRVQRPLLELPAPVAVIEWAEAAGFVEGSSSARAESADSRGVGRLIGAALDHGCASVVLGLGGSATTDGGAGMLCALGARLVDRHGQTLPPGGRGLTALAEVDLTALRRCPLLALVDVDSPLLGAGGTVARFAAQKGADASARARLDEGLARWAEALDPGGEIGRRPGAGAAGGAGFGLAAALGAELRPGAAAVASLCGLDAALDRAERVWTGEGRLDGTTAVGKVPSEVVRRADVPVALIGGDLGPGAAGLDELGARRVVTLVEPPSVQPPACWIPLGRARTREEALRAPAESLEELARRLARIDLA